MLPEGSSEAAAALIPRVKVQLARWTMHWQPAGHPHAKTALVHLNASEGLFDGRGQRVVISVEDEDSEQLCRLFLLALRLIEWIAPGGSDQLSPAR